MRHAVRIFFNHRSTVMGSLYLFNIKESTLVVDALPNLDNSLPHLCGGMGIDIGWYQNNLNVPNVTCTKNMQYYSLDWYKLPNSSDTAGFERHTLPQSSDIQWE